MTADRPDAAKLDRYAWKWYYTESERIIERLYWGNYENNEYCQRYCQ